MAKQPIYRVTVFFTKKPGMSDEDFGHHWANVHGPLVALWVEKHGILEYTQFHTPPHLRSQNTGHVPSGEGMLDYDGAADWYMKDYAAYEAAYKDPYYVNVIEPDEHNFVDKYNGQTRIVGAASTIGFCRTIVKDGKAVVQKAVLTEEQQKFLQGPGIETSPLLAVT